MTRWTERPCPYARPNPSEVTTSGKILEFVERRKRTGIDFDLLTRLNDDYVDALFDEERERIRLQRLMEDISAVTGRPRRK